MPIHPERIVHLNRRDERRGDYVLYWMQQSQRAEYNHALEHAITVANRLQLPLRVIFGLTDDYPEANQRHYAFMLEGLKETQRALAQRGIAMAVRRGSPPEVTLGAARKAAAIVCDRGYLRHLKEWRRQVAQEANCPVIQVESDVVVPVQSASDHREVGARTLRGKIHKRLGEFLTELRPARLTHRSVGAPWPGINLDNVEALLRKLDLDRSVRPVAEFFRGGTAQAKKRFEAFLRLSLRRYGAGRARPETDDVSRMSPYLHFGQISPVYLALRLGRAKSARADAEKYFEELVVRRELSMNFVEFTPDYDSIACLPAWARRSLAAHEKDRRTHIYSRADLEEGRTHDPYWNAATREMRATGYMHSYMRMYWAKKILEWSLTPEQAFCTTLAIMNKYFLDGRDANSYTGVAWVYGNHDRPFLERPVFGKIRYFSSAGLERKADAAGYIRKVEGLLNAASKTSERAA